MNTSIGNTFAKRFRHIDSHARPGPRKTLCGSSIHYRANLALEQPPSAFPIEQQPSRLSKAQDCHSSTASSDSARQAISTVPPRFSAHLRKHTAFAGIFTATSTRARFTEPLPTTFCRFQTPPQTLPRWTPPKNGRKQSSPTFEQSSYMLAPATTVSRTRGIT